MTNQDIEITSFNLNDSDDWPCTIYESDNSKNITNDQYVLYENCYSVYKVKIGNVPKWKHLDFLLNDDINLNSVSQHINLNTVTVDIEDNEDIICKVIIDDWNNKTYFAELNLNNKED